jgi:colanic acid biosynthesis glycosyl transferase WcaI
MRVVIVTQYFWPEDFRVNDLAAELARRGHEVTVLTGQPSYPDRDRFRIAGRSRRPWTERWESVQVLRSPLLSRGRGQGWRLAGNFLSFAASASLVAALRIRRADVVFVYEPSPVTVGIPAMVVKRLTGAPIVFWVQDLWPETLAATGAVRSSVALAVLRRLVRRIYRSCDRILVESRSFVDSVVANGAEPERIAYVPNWAETTYAPVEPAPDAPQRARLPDGFVVLFAGNLGTAQSLDTLVGAADRLRDLPDIHWVVVGSGRAGDELAAEVARRGLTDRVHLLGRYPVADMSAFFSLADVLLVTLRRAPIYALTIPSKLQSYLACGRPVVGALDGAGAEVIRESGAGRTAPAEDAEGLAVAVRELRALPANERAEMGARGRTYFLEHFDRDRLLSEVEKHMLQIVGM